MEGNKSYTRCHLIKTILKFNKNTTDIKCFIRINNEGYFRNLHIGINENAIKITNSLEVDLHCKIGSRQVIY